MSRQKGIFSAKARQKASGVSTKGKRDGRGKSGPRERDTSQKKNLSAGALFKPRTPPLLWGKIFCSKGEGKLNQILQR